MKRGLMKQRAPLAWQQSSSDGARTLSHGQLGGLPEEEALWVGGGGLSGADASDAGTEPWVVFQKPGRESQKGSLH